MKILEQVDRFYQLHQLFTFWWWFLFNGFVDLCKVRQHGQFIDATLLTPIIRTQHRLNPKLLLDKGQRHPYSLSDVIQLLEVAQVADSGAEVVDDCAESETVAPRIVEVGYVDVVVR